MRKIFLLSKPPGFWLVVYSSKERLTQRGGCALRGDFGLGSTGIIGRDQHERRADTSPCYREQAGPAQSPERTQDAASGSESATALPQLGSARPSPRGGRGKRTGRCGREDRKTSSPGADGEGPGRRRGCAVETSGTQEAVRSRSERGEQGRGARQSPGGEGLFYRLKKLLPEEG